MKGLRTQLVRAGLVALVAVVLLLGTNPGRDQQIAAWGGPAEGIVCTTGTSPNPTFTLTTKTGYIVMPDANTVFMWGYSAGTDPFQHPGPVLCVNQGDTVTVTLRNTLPEDVSIIFPGQQNVLANGAPAQPQFAGGTLTSLTDVAPANGGSMTYSFVASAPGTYIYESGTEPAKQVRMGLFGALIVRPASHPDWAYNVPTVDADAQFNPDAEYMVLLSEIDPYLNQAVERGLPFDMKNYHPRYWPLNGRGFPDTIAPNFAPWLPSQPYGALARIHPYNNSLPASDPAYNPYPGLVRYLNVGSEEFPFHPHGNHGRVIARDAQPRWGPGSEDLSIERFAMNIGAGQTWDLTFRWRDAEGYDAMTNPVPVSIPDMVNLVYGMFYSGSPYLGMMGPMPVGMPMMNECGEYYIISHNHALNQITSWGAPMTGPITWLRIDPPLPNMCP